MRYNKKSSKNFYKQGNSLRSSKDKKYNQPEA